MLNQQKISVILGIVIIILPFLGFTRFIKNGIFVICGLIILTFALKEIRKIQKSTSKEKTDVFVESKPQEKTSEINNPKSETLSELNDSK